MELIKWSVGIFCVLIVELLVNTTSHLLIMLDLHQLGCSCHPVCRTSFASCREISNFSRTLLRHFRRTISDATGAKSEVTCFLAGGEVLLTLLRAIKSSMVRTASFCISALDCSLICECPGPWYRRAVFIGDELAVHGMPCSYAADGQGAILAPVYPRRQPYPLGSIDEQEYCGYACRRKHFLFRPCLFA